MFAYLFLILFYYYVYLIWCLKKNSNVSNKCNKSIISKRKGTLVYINVSRNIEVLIKWLVVYTY
jgi:hypothetical protein